MPNLHKIILALCLPISMVCIDVMALSVALDAIVIEFRTPIYLTQWLFTAYMIANCAFLVATGQLADIYGKQRVLLFGIVGFTAASLLGACSYNFWLLIIARAIQGLASAGIMTTTIALITSNFELPERSKIFAVWMFAVGAGLAFGPLIGGIIVYFFDWRLIFLINIPIGIFSYIWVKKYIPEPVINAVSEKSKLLNALLLSITITILALLLSEGDVWGWGSESTFLVLLAFFGSLAFFIYFEMKKAFPIIHIKLYKKPAFIISTISGFFSYFFMYAWLFIFSIYLQEVRGLSSLVASFVCVSFSVAFAFGPLVLNKLTTNLGRSGFIIFGFSGILLAFTGMSLSPFTMPLTMLMITFFILGFSIATINVASMAIATHGVSKNISGSVSGVIFTIRWLGGAIGVVVATIIYHVTSISKLKIDLKDVQNLPLNYDKLTNLVFSNHISNVKKQFSEQADVLIPIIKSALTSGLTKSCVILAILSFSCMIIVTLLTQFSKKNEIKI